MAKFEDDQAVCHAPSRRMHEALQEKAKRDLSRVLPPSASLPAGLQDERSRVLGDEEDARIRCPIL